jgi:hypothetical protein
VGSNADDISNDVAGCELKEFLNVVLLLCFVWFEVNQEPARLGTLA